MKRLALSTFVLALALVLAPAASAQNSLAVTSAAAMGNSVPNQNCSGDGLPGPCGLELRYQPGQTNQARVVKSDFGVEQVFRERFWMDVSNFEPRRFTRNFYHLATGCFPRNEPGCTLLPAFRSDIVQKGFTQYAIGAGALDNIKNWVGIPRCPVPHDRPFELQFEWRAGCFPNKGDFVMTVFVDGAQTCQNSVKVENCWWNVQRFNFVTWVEGGIENASPVYIDEYQSFRTLAP